jgi:hypothetical protein
MGLDSSATPWYGPYTNMRTPEERRRQQQEMLLRYTVLRCGARAGVLLKREPNGELRTLAETAGWSPADTAATGDLWAERSGVLNAGQPQCRGPLVAWPLHDEHGHVSGFVVLSGVGPDFTPTPDEQDLFARLSAEANDKIPRDPMRALVLALLAWLRRQRSLAAIAAARAA